MERQGLSVSVSGITAQVTTPTGSPVIAANSNSGSSSGSSGGSSGTSLGLIIGAAGGGVGGVVLAGLAFFLYRKYRVRVNPDQIDWTTLFFLVIISCDDI